MIRFCDSNQSPEFPASTLRQPSRIAAVAAGGLFLIVLTASAQIPRFYTYDTDLLASARTAFPSYGLSAVDCIRMNSHGDLIGYLHGSAIPAPTAPNGTRAAAWVRGQWHDLQSHVQGSLKAHDINEAGHVVGFYVDPHLTIDKVGSSGQALFVWNEAQGLCDLRHPVQRDRGFFENAVAQLNDIGDGEVIASGFSWLTELGGIISRDVAVTAGCSGSWTMAPIGARIIDLNNQSQVLGYDGLGAWIGSGPAEVSTPSVRVLISPRSFDGREATPVILTEDGDILWDNGSLTTRDGTFLAQAPFEGVYNWWKGRAIGGTILVPFYPAGYTRWDWRTGEFVDNVWIYDGSLLRGTAAVDFNRHGQILTPSRVCTPSAPIFRQHPSNTSATIGSSVVLEAVVAGAISVQWEKDGQPVPGATNASGSLILTSRLTIPRADSAHAGNYRLLARNVTGSAVSTSAGLDIIRPQLFSSQLAFPLGGAVEITVPVPVGVRVIIEASHDLNHWEAVANTVAPQPFLTVVDASASTAAARFYRLQFSLP